MKRIIFTTYDDIDQEKDQWNVNSYSTHMTLEYFDKLVENKSKYAESIGVDFKIFRNTMKDFNVDAGFEFTKVNLYKHHLMSQLAEEYDEVMYVDMDVVFNTKENVFDQLNLEEGVHIKDQDQQIISKNVEEVLLSEIGNRSPTLKYHITKDLLEGADNHVLNTGIVIGKSEHIKQIKFVERLSGVIEKINDIKKNALTSEKNGATFLRMYYYPNNESIFSYILEKYQIPYVIMEDEWHYIINENPKQYDWKDIKIAHFLNKKFNAYFNDKTKCIFSLYIEIPDERLDNPVGPKDDPVNKSKRTQERLAKYAKHLYKNHDDYAKKVGATHLHFTRDEEYENFFEKFPDLSEYDVVNLYKIYLLDKLVKEYDLVLYVDFDTYFTCDIDAFNYIKAENGLACDTATARESGVFPDDQHYFEEYNKDFRNPQSKYWNAHALLMEEDIEGDQVIFNTGIMMANKQVMEQIDYFGDIESVIATMKELKNSSMYPEKIQAAFGYDNETIMAYKTKKNNVVINKLPVFWHYKHDHNRVDSYDKQSKHFEIIKNQFEATVKNLNIIIVHFISKNFGLVFHEAS